MFRRSAYSAANLGDLERQVRSLERRLDAVASSAHGAVARRADDLGDVITSTLGAIAERFRDGTASFGDAGHLGREAAKMGTDALQRLSKEVERRPLITLGVAVGVGLLVGLASHRR